MVDNIAARIVGIPAFSTELRKLSMDMQQKVVRSASLAAAAVFRKGAVALAPELKKPDARRKRGALKKGIYAGRSRSRSKPGAEVIVVGVRSGKPGKNGDPFYWRWVEDGYIARGPGQRIKGGFRRRALERSRLKSAGKLVPGVKMFARSFSSNQDKALSAFNSRLAARIDKANKDLNGR
jgi:hypothetical protein